MLADEQALAAALAARLAPWFAENARDLPWRKDRTGYRVWLSEVMLQQTRVATVIPYYARFLERFPRLVDLANADEGEVLALWSGLGYYRRARGLHEGAKDVVARFGGELPRTAPELLTIRGIGPYTAGAISSLAHGQREPLVDGNVVRVFARVFGLREDFKPASAQKKIWTLARAALPADAPGAFNEAVMELGATVCLPREPRCMVCPLFDICIARREGIAHLLPVLSKDKPVRQVHAAALVARDERGVLLARRRGDALFGGLWEPPMVEAETPEAAEAAALFLSPGAARRGTVTHLLSHRHMTVAVLDGAIPEETIRYPDLYDEVRFVADADFPSYGISTLARKILAAVAPASADAKTARAPRSRAPKNRLRSCVLLRDPGQRSAVCGPAKISARRALAPFVAAAVALGATVPPRTALAEERGPYAHFFGSLAAGSALRFNNPYRLSTQLGETGRSVSVAAPYTDIALAALVGSPTGVHHGLHVHLSTAITGISQSVVAPSYIAAIRRPLFTAYGRAGLPFVLAPQSSTGLEFAVGGLYYLRNGVALTAELGESLFYGAATREVAATFIPLTYLQAGVAIDFEVLP